jgi:hypothetical protein
MVFKSRDGLRGQVIKVENFTAIAVKNKQFILVFMTLYIMRLKGDSEFLM